MPRYNHDMMHCSQEQCPKKGKCYRYWLAQNAVSNGWTTYTVYFPSKKKVLDNCEHFTDIKDW